ncbi:unnamed protein product [Allacma fusca]|uniref:Uncharacterized protein n=1 Tax=Allacma fusca TaxID=39272 RepID=A0A8J2JE61_9HEXA|nr:unnamed protein product [Allacma fusca]
MLSLSSPEFLLARTCSRIAGNLTIFPLICSVFLAINAQTDTYHQIPASSPNFQNPSFINSKEENCWSTTRNWEATT